MLSTSRTAFVGDSSDRILLLIYEKLLYPVVPDLFKFLLPEANPNYFSKLDLFSAPPSIFLFFIFLSSKPLSINILTKEIKLTFVWYGICRSCKVKVETPLRVTRFGKWFWWNRSCDVSRCWHNIQMRVDIFCTLWWHLA